MPGNIINVIGFQNGPRGAMIGPRGPSRAPKKRKRTAAKTLKKHCFFNVFGVPRPSKTASCGPRRLPKDYLGLFGGVLNHLGAILQTTALTIDPAAWDCAVRSPRWPILGPFGAILGPILGAILGPNRPKRSQDEPKRAIKSPKEPKTYNTKNLKKPLVF